MTALAPSVPRPSFWSDPFPSGLVHHLCGVKRCVNPSHLQPLTRAAHAHCHAPQNLIGNPRRRGHQKGRCQRWRINRGLPCVCGKHEEVQDGDDQG